MPPSAVTEKMATGLTDEEQIKFFSDLFSGYETTIHNIQKLSPDEQMADEFNTHENTPINKLLSNVEANYNHDTPVPVLEYVFNRLIDTQEFHTAEAKRLEANGEEDYLTLNNESYSDWIFDTGKDLMHFWTHKADDVRQKIWPLERNVTKRASIGSISKVSSLNSLMTIRRTTYPHHLIVTLRSLPRKRAIRRRSWRRTRKRKKGRRRKGRRGRRKKVQVKVKRRMKMSRHLSDLVCNSRER